MNNIKINIMYDQYGEEIDGFTNISHDQITNVINGTINEIICSVLDYCEYQERINLIITLCKKIANNGTITFKFINGTKLFKDAIKGNSNSQYLSKIIKDSKSLFLESDVLEVVSQINAVQIFKQFNSNEYSILVLQKKL